MIKPLKKQLGLLGIIVFVAAWQAYAGFEHMFAMTTQEMENRNNELWFFTGPISLFLASALGLLFAFVATTTRDSRGKKFWSALLWVPTAWLSLGALAFLYLDWLGRGFRSSISEHLWHGFIIALPMSLAALLLGSLALTVRKMPVASPPEQTTAWKRVLATGARVLAWLSLVAGSLLAVLASALVLLMVSCTPPSLPSLARRFPSERPDLETIIHMSDQDSGLSVIDPSWLQLRNGTQFLSFDPKAGITEARWDEYRRIFRRNDITQGIRRFQPNGDAFILVKSEGLLDRGYSNGFVYCGAGPEHSYPPCSSKEEHAEHPYTQGDEAYSFIKLADRWYAFSQGPG